MPEFPSCPHCHVRNVMFTLHHCTDMKTSENSLHFLSCNNCGKGVSAIYPTTPVMRDFSTHAQCIISALKSNSIKYDDYLEVFPEPQDLRAPQDTPPNIASDYIEAASSLQQNNFKAACVMARSAIETTSVHFGAQRGGLKDKIEYLADNHIIAPALKEWANEIKNIGNDAAHAAENKTVRTKQDAEDAVHFTEMLLTYLFTLPGMIEKRRHKKE